MFLVSVQVLFFVFFLSLAILIVLPCRNLFHVPEIRHKSELSLEGLRGLAALAVVACHVNQTLLSYLLNIQEIPTTVNRIGGLAVQIFFALTAYLFTKKALNEGISPSFYKKRIARIAPLYVFLSICTILLSIHYMDAPIFTWDTFFRCINVLTFGFIGNNTDLYLPNYDLLVFSNYNALELIGIAWSLSYEWRFYLILPVLYYLSQHSTKKRIMILIIIMMLAMRDFYIYNSSKVVWPFFIGGSLCALITYYFPRLLVNVRLSKILSFFSLFLLVISVITPDVYTFRHFILTSSFFICIVIGKPKFLQAKPLLALGQISYSIYLMQYLVLRLISRSIYPYMLHFPLTVKLLGGFLIIIILIPFATSTYRFIELPGMNGTLLSFFVHYLSRFKVLSNVYIRKIGLGHRINNST